MGVVMDVCVCVTETDQSVAVRSHTVEFQLSGFGLVPPTRVFRGKGVRQQDVSLPVDRFRKALRSRWGKSEALPREGQAL